MASQITRPRGHADSAFVVSVSGGKDSTATLLALREAEIPCQYVFADTGWEALQTYEYLDTLRARLGITIDVVGVPGGMRAKMDERAGFPARMQRWCTRELKIEPIRRYHDVIEETQDVDTICVTGIRAEESPQRALFKVFEYEDPGKRRWGGYLWRPLLAWTVQDVLAIHHRHDVPVNPLYRLGFDRVGCLPCIYARKEDVRLVAKHFPERIDEIDELEHRFVALRQQRNEETPGRYARAEDASYFQARVRRRVGPRVIRIEIDAATGRRRRIDESEYVYDPMTIRDMVAWSRTARGGKQLHVVQPAPDGGCFRWGFCDAPSKEVA